MNPPTLVPAALKKSYDALNQESLQKAREGDAESQALVAEAFADGEIVPQDLGIAIDWYQKAAEQGFALAQTQLGFNLLKMVPGEQGHRLAIKWFEMAAKNGNEVAQCNTGLFRAEGWGGPVDWKQAVFWYEKAAQAGHSGAQLNLGMALFAEPQVTPDPARGLKLLNQAADQGVSMAMLALGELYENGPPGVTINQKTAIDYYRRGAAEGEPSCQEALRRLGAG